LVKNEDILNSFSTNNTLKVLPEESSTTNNSTSKLSPSTFIHSQKTKKISSGSGSTGQSGRRSPIVMPRGLIPAGNLNMNINNIAPCSSGQTSGSNVLTQLTNDSLLNKANLNNINYHKLELSPSFLNQTEQEAEQQILLEQNENNDNFNTYKRMTNNSYLAPEGTAYKQHFSSTSSTNNNHQSHHTPSSSQSSHQLAAINRKNQNQNGVSNSVTFSNFAIPTQKMDNYDCTLSRSSHKGTKSSETSEFSQHTDDNLYKTMSERRKVRSGNNGQTKYVVRSLTHV